MAALRACESCGRHALPAYSEVPPSNQLCNVMVELLRFADEFDAVDPEGSYTALDFVDWMALNVGRPLRVEPAGRPGRRRGLGEVHRLANSA